MKRPRGRPRGPGSAREREHKPDAPPKLVAGAGRYIDACARRRGLDFYEANIAKTTRTLELESELCGEEKW